jgi:hypothetical protein
MNQKFIKVAKEFFTELDTRFKSLDQKKLEEV